MHRHVRHPLMVASAACLFAPLAAAPAWAQKPEPPPTIAPPQGMVPPEEPGSGSVIRPRNRRDDDFSTVAREVWRGLQLGESTQSELDRADASEPDGSLYEDWTFRGVRGTRVTLSMSSGDFDSYLLWGRVIDGKFVALATDDDGGEGAASRLTVWVRDDLEYVVRANTFAANTRGRYRLFVEDAAPAPDAAAPRGDVHPGQTVRGALGPGDPLLARGTYYEVWRFRGRPGQRVTVTLHSSDFDALLLWARVVGAEPVPVESDDDGGAGTDSEVTVEVDTTGEYAVMVSSMGPAQTGAYTLHVEQAGR